MIKLATENVDTSAPLRRGVLALALIGATSGLVELGTLRHWNGTQLIPWIVFIVMIAMTGWIALRPSRPIIRIARPVSVLAVVSSAFGIYQHISENYSTAPLDRSFGPKWESMSMAARVWHAASGSVGPSPLLAPGLLAQVGICVLLATMNHPVLGDASTP